MSDAKKILVIGTGSAGKRHARNLRSLDCQIACFDPREDRIQEAKEEGSLISGYTNFEQAVQDQPWDGVVIASPPHVHVEQILFILDKLTCPILTEKPLSINADLAKKLSAHSSRILLGYTYRWWEPLRVFRQKLLDGEIGSLRNMRIVMSAHLEDWHPWEPYQDFFMSQKELGGGALLDESHFIDIMLWMGIEVDNLYAQVDKISDLKMDADDNVDIILRAKNNVRANLHLDLIGRPHERSITAIGEKGTMIYSYELNKISQAETAETNWIDTHFEGERNDMFMGVAKEYLELLNGNEIEKSCTIEDGIAALKVVDACRESSQTGQSIQL